MATPRSLAVGLTHVDQRASHQERRTARVHLALAVNDRGYVLIETLELGLGALADDVALAVVEDLTAAHDVQVLALGAGVDATRIQHLADRLRLSVWTPRTLGVVTCEACC